MCWNVAGTGRVPVFAYRSTVVQECTNVFQNEWDEERGGWGGAIACVLLLGGGGGEALVAQ